MPQSAEERREKKKNAEKKRRQRIKNNSELHNAVKEKARQRYHSSKARGVILPASEMTLQQKRAKQLRDRLKSKLYRERKKQLAKRALQEDLVFCENNPPIANDPLSLPCEPPIRRSSQRLSKRLQTIGTSTPLPDPSTQSVDTSYKSPNILPSCSKTTSNDDFTNIACTSTVPLSPKKLYSRAWVDDGSSTISPSTNSDTSSISSIDSSPTTSPRSQRRSKAGNNTLRKDMYKLKKHAFEKKLMHKRIEELKTLNSKYRKQLSRLKKNILEIKKIKNLVENTDASNYNEEVEDSENSIKEESQYGSCLW